jgi:dipeptidyl aminopeptidase/acylaminoacyl peptidase
MIRRHFLQLAASAAAFSAVSARAQGPAAAAPAGPRPAADFASLPFMDNPALSPDGSKVAARLAVKGEQYFAILSVFGNARPAIVLPGKNDINWWRWVNNDWLVLGIAAVESLEGVDFYVRRVLGVSADGKILNQIANRDAGEGADDVIWIASDGTPRIRLSLQRSVYYQEEGFWPEVIEADVSTGKSSPVVRAEKGVTEWYADGTGTVRIGVGYALDGRNQQLLYRERDGANFHIVDRASTRKSEHLIVPVLFLPEPGQAIAIDNPDGFDAVYKLDLKTMALGDKLFGAPGYDVDGIIADAARTRLLGVRVTEEAPKVHWLDPELAEVQAAIDKSVPGRRARILSIDDKRQRFLVHLGAGDRPGAYYFMDTNDGRLQRLANVNDRIGTARVNPVRTFRYKARDGLEIQAVLTLSAAKEAKALPVVVMPHGGPLARDDEEWDFWAQFLAELGYAIVQPNFRGSSGFGRDFALKGRGQWGLAMQDDINDALAELVRLGVADGKRAAICGASYGGYAALRAAQRDGSLYRCAISFAGVSDLGALLRYDSTFLNTGADRDWVKSQAPDLKAVSPINFPEQFSIPVLLVHGKADRRVPVKQSRQMAEALQKAGKDVRYVEQPLGDHHLSREADRLALLQEVEAFLKQHNPA